MKEDNYYFDHDGSEGGYATHIAHHAIIKIKGEKDDEKAGIILCSNRVVYHGGMNTNSILEEEYFDDGGICPKCIREYKGDN